MGVPVVTKLGNSIPSRLSGAILAAIGLKNWVATNEEDYIGIAVKVASMPDRLRTLRHELPKLIAASAAGDCVQYTRAVETAYRTMWKYHCNVSSRQSIIRD